MVKKKDFITSNSNLYLAIKKAMPIVNNANVWKT